MDFTKEMSVVDENDETATVTFNFQASLVDGVAEIFAVDADGNKTSLVLQPWKTNSDGTRSDWVDLDEVVAWYQDLDVAF